jgi:hypothetical protein
MTMSLSCSTDPDPSGRWSLCGPVMVGCLEAGIGGHDQSGPARATVHADVSAPDPILVSAPRKEWTRPDREVRSRNGTEALLENRHCKL